MFCGPSLKNKFTLSFRFLEKNHRNCNHDFNHDFSELRLSCQLDQLAKDQKSAIVVTVNG